MAGKRKATKRQARSNQKHEAKQAKAAPPVKQRLFTRRRVFRLLIAALGLLVAVGVYVGYWAWSEYREYPPTISKEEFFFFNESPQMQELWRILHQKDDRIDLAYCNLLIASTLPGSATIDIDANLKRLEGLAERVEELHDRTPRGRYKTEQERRLMALCSVIHEIGFDYNPTFQKTELAPDESTAMYSDPRNVFLHGILAGKENGSCVNMPLIYLALAERLGYPVHGVTIGQHVFVRWDDGRYRMNVEPTITKTIAMTPDDSVYFDSEHLTRKDVEGTSWLKSLSKKEMIGHFFSARAGYTLTRGPMWTSAAAADLIRADALCPNNPYTKRNLETARRANYRNSMRTLGGPDIDDPNYIPGLPPGILPPNPRGR